MKKSPANKVVLITHPAEASGDTEALLKKAKFQPVFFPTIQTVFTQPDKSDAVKLESARYDFIIFSSVNAVKFFLYFIRESGVKFDFNSAQIAASGRKTAEYCEKFNLNVKIIPGEYSASGLLKFFEKQGVSGRKFLIPASAIARKELYDGLKKLGAEVEFLTIYNTITAVPDNRKIREITKSAPSYYIFTSPSSFINYLKIFLVDNPGEYFSGKNVFAIGKTTAESIVKFGVENVRYPKEFTLNKTAELVIDKN